MTIQEEILKSLYDSVVEGDAGRARQAAMDSLEAGIPPLVAINAGLTSGIREVGARFGRCEVFLPEMITAAEAMEEAIAVLEPHMAKDETKKKGRILIGTAKGDIHDLGKNIVIALLKVSGYEVIDLGRDIPSSQFIDRAIESSVQVIGISCLLTTTMPMMRDIIEMMDEEGVRGRFKVIIGGGPTSQAYADQIGADGYGETAQDAVDLCDRLLGFTAAAG
jgi:corrinoid protein of di/trimethylamine methyltransferase